MKICGKIGEFCQMYFRIRQMYSPTGRTYSETGRTYFRARRMRGLNFALCLNFSGVFLRQDFVKFVRSRNVDGAGGFNKPLKTLKLTTKDNKVSKRC